MTKLFYWNKFPNFGDSLGSLLLKKFSYINSEWSPAASSDITITGSVLHLLPNDYAGIVAGIGKLHEKTKFNLPKANILGLRGYLTASGVKGDYVVADPGLLADELVPVEDKEWNLGIVPHWTDNQLEKNPLFLKYKPKIIRVTDDPLRVISEIGRCKKIVSSSLHGIILADSFNIPRRIEIAPRLLSHPNQEGGVFKFEDYLSGIGMKLKVGETQDADHRIVAEKQHELFDMFDLIKNLTNG